MKSPQLVRSGGRYLQWPYSTGSKVYTTSHLINIRASDGRPGHTIQCPLLPNDICNTSSCLIDINHGEYGKPAETFDVDIGY